MRWKFYGQARPAFANAPKAGQESVWDYPRPPRVERDFKHVRVSFDGVEVANSLSPVRVLETASAPGIYVPREDVRMELLRPSATQTWCEWKGMAEYYDLVTEHGNAPDIAWSYPQVQPGFAAIAGLVSFYPSRVECYIDDERVRPQPGGFYGGWVTAATAGPTKGAPGTGGW